MIKRPTIRPHHNLDVPNFVAGLGGMLTANDFDMLQKIADRYEKLSKIFNTPLAKFEFMLDVALVHTRNIKLDFKKMLESSDANFLSDTILIIRNINRVTGYLDQGVILYCSK